MSDTISKIEAPGRYLFEDSSVAPDAISGQRPRKLRYGVRGGWKESASSNYMPCYDPSTGSVIALAPLLVLWMGYGERQATGVSLAAIVVIATGGSILQAFYGNVDVARAALIGLPAVGVRTGPVPHDVPAVEPDPRVQVPPLPPTYTFSLRVFAPPPCLPRSLGTGAADVPRSPLPM